MLRGSRDTLKIYQRILIIQLLLLNLLTVVVSTSTLYQLLPYSVYLTRLPEAWIPFQIMAIINLIAFFAAFFAYSFLQNFIATALYRLPWTEDWKGTLSFTKKFLIIFWSTPMFSAYAMVVCGVEFDMSRTKQEALEFDPRLQELFNDWSFFVPLPTVGVVAILIIYTATAFLTILPITAALVL
ncbi:unnamed protein product [Caenorhabditis auriculariae]|uniref:Uncharacterized protein n=1 Tax=Caenorhabditis auriculariae TaxID=2777116 RepID=A0A8S1HFV1_9PELO|nr:unnamed protein product [Caenorhabditis auriculariae]